MNFNFFFFEFFYMINFVLLIQREIETPEQVARNFINLFKYKKEKTQNLNNITISNIRKNMTFEQLLIEGNKIEYKNVKINLAYDLKHIHLINNKDNFSISTKINFLSIKYPSIIIQGNSDNSYSLIEPNNPEINLYDDYLSEYKYFQREGEKQKKDFFIDFIPKSITQILKQYYLSDFEYEFSFYKESIESLKSFKVNFITSRNIKEASISNIIYTNIEKKDGEEIFLNVSLNVNFQDSKKKFHSFKVHYKYISLQKDYYDLHYPSSSCRDCISIFEDIFDRVYLSNP